MTLDEAIEHAEEKSKNSSPCANDHKQLVKWLKELRNIKRKDEMILVEYRQIETCVVIDELQFEVVYLIVSTGEKCKTVLHIGINTFKDREVKAVIQEELDAKLHLQMS